MFAFRPRDGDSTVLWSIETCLPDYTGSYYTFTIALVRYLNLKNNYDNLKAEPIDFK